MRDYGKVSPQFWVGRTGKSLRGNANAQIVALYLMTSPHANMIGVYYCPLAYISNETGLSLDAITKALEALTDFCTIDSELEYVFVHQFASNQIGEQLKPDDKRVKGIINELAKLPESECKKAFIKHYQTAFYLSPLEEPNKPLRSPISTPSKPEAGAEAETELTCESSPSAEPPVIAMPLHDKTEYPIGQSLIDEWQATFQAVNVMQALREMRVWCIANPKKCKTKTGVQKFVVNWLGSEQDKGRYSPQSSRSSTSNAAMRVVI